MKTILWALRSAFTISRFLELRDRARRARERLKRYARNESGAAAVEYGLIVAGIALLLIPAAIGVGASLGAVYALVAAALAMAGQ